MKRYSEYMDSVEVPEELHERLTGLTAPEKRPVWRKYGAVAAALALAAGVGALAVSRLGSAGPHSMESLEEALSPAVDIAPAAPGEDSAGTGDNTKTIEGYEVAAGDGAQGAASYYILPYIAYGDAPEGALADYSLVPPDGGFRDADIGDFLSILGCDEAALADHLDWNDCTLTGRVGFNADGSAACAYLYGDSDAFWFELELCPDRLPPQCCLALGLDVTTTEVWGVEVAGVKNVGMRGDSERGIYLDKSLRTEFLAHGVGVRCTFYGTDEDTLAVLMSRLVRWAIVEGLDLTQLSSDGAEPVNTGGSVVESSFEDGADTPFVPSADPVESVPAKAPPSVDQEDNPAAAMTAP